MRRLVLLVLALALPAPPAPAAAPVTIVAAENFYGDIAQQIGGPEVTVTSVLSSPDQDPHLFEASPSVARALTAARLVVYNGLGYDPWIERLLAASSAPGRKAIAVAALTGRKPGDNPHLWYDPKTMPAVAAVLASELTAIDPAHAAGYRTRLERFDRSLQPVAARVAALKTRLAGMPATATEPIFGYMFAALGMTVRNHGFQLAVMNNTEPGASQMAAFEDDLKRHRVRLLVYNSQASHPAAKRMVAIARSARIPVVAVTETEPRDTTYQQWISDELGAVDRALPP
jgi:zinc/manganese transport system substrate-binding protein